METRPDLSIVTPMYNEEENVSRTIALIREAMASLAGTWELVIVNDGSTDGSLERANELAAGEPNARVVGYSENRGRGYALRTGFYEARGRIVATVDFDLSYSPDHVLHMYDILRASPQVDMVMASCYMPGGAVTGVSPSRLAVSRLGNVILRQAFRRRFHTTTCMVRAYRGEVLEALELESEGKEIHLEILSKALALGFNVIEMPATLAARKRGKAKFNFLRTSLTHLIFAAEQEPSLVVKSLLALFSLGAAAAVVGVALRRLSWRYASVEYPGPAVVAPLVKIAIVLGLAYLCVGLYGLIARRLKQLRVASIRQESRLRLLARAGRRGHANGRVEPGQARAPKVP